MRSVPTPRKAPAIWRNSLKSAVPGGKPLSLPLHIEKTMESNEILWISLDSTDSQFCRTPFLYSFFRSKTLISINSPGPRAGKSGKRSSNQRQSDCRWLLEQNALPEGGSPPVVAKVWVRLLRRLGGNLFLGGLFIRASPPPQRWRSCSKNFHFSRRAGLGN